MPDDLYHHDALAWAEQQAALLRRLAGGERVNDAVDWSHVIEEVEDFGLSELRGCRSLLRHALVHLLKLHAWPASEATARWRGELAGVLTDARDSFTPSMRQRIDVAELYADALYAARAGTDASGAARKMPDSCPFQLDDLIAARPAIDALVARLSD